MKPIRALLPPATASWLAALSVAANAAVSSVDIPTGANNLLGIFSGLFAVAAVMIAMWKSLQAYGSGDHRGIGQAIAGFILAIGFGLGSAYLLGVWQGGGAINL